MSAQRLLAAALLVLCSSPVVAEGENALASKALYEHRCGICHSTGGTGTVMLKRRSGIAEPILARRTDLSADLVRFVVRNGVNSMPVFNRGELTDVELNQIIEYLTRPATHRALEK